MQGTQCFQAVGHLTTCAAATEPSVGTEMGLTSPPIRGAKICGEGAEARYDTCNRSKTPREHGILNTGHASKHDQFHKQRGDLTSAGFRATKYHRRHLLPTLVSDRRLYKGNERSGGALPINLDFRSRGFPRERKRMSPPRRFKEIAGLCRTKWDSNAG